MLLDEYLKMHGVTGGVFKHTKDGASLLDTLEMGIKTEDAESFQSGDKVIIGPGAREGQPSSITLTDLLMEQEEMIKKKLIALLEIILMQSMFILFIKRTLVILTRIRSSWVLTAWKKLEIYI